MEIPPRYVTIVEDIVSRSLKYVERGRVPAPTLIKGSTYSGANLLVHEVHKRLMTQPEKGFNTKFLRLRLCDSLLSNEISRELSLFGKPSKKSTIFFMDGIDRTLNLSAKNLKKSVKAGRNAKTNEIIEEAHKLRKVLLENTNKVSLISSAGLITSFMEDPDQPFYKFFNETTIGTLSAEESVKYFFSQIKKHNALDLKLPFISELAEASFEWPYKISGGNWLLLQKLHQVLALGTKSNTTTKNTNSIAPLEEYFLQIQPILLMEMATFNREERRFIENAACLGTSFGLKEMAFDQGNTSLIAKKLAEKMILSKVEKSNGRYVFSHLALRTFLRYFSGANLIDVFSDERILL